MPMDYKYIELELDAVEKMGAGRITQEMAKNPALPGSETMPTFPLGIPPAVMEAKRAKTLAAVETTVTQVRRKER